MATSTLSIPAYHSFTPQQLSHWWRTRHPSPLLGDAFIPGVVALDWVLGEAGRRWADDLFEATAACLEERRLYDSSVMQLTWSGFNYDFITQFLQWGKVAYSTPLRPQVQEVLLDEVPGSFSPTAYLETLQDPSLRSSPWNGTGGLAHLFAWSFYTSFPQEEALRHLEVFSAGPDLPLRRCFHLFKDNCQGVKELLLRGPLSWSLPFLEGTEA